MNLLLLLSAILAGFTGGSGDARVAQQRQVEARAEAVMQVLAVSAEAAATVTEQRLPVARIGDAGTVFALPVDMSFTAPAQIRGERRLE